ncbi:MAG: amidohydrolase family protein [Woeseiaceae bacterium]|jgi:predicted amidohydrolase YtcJ|nr:amidohydrolase family protein [Woeseiaceae bacterium]
MNVMKTALLVGMLGVLIASCTSGEGGGDQQGADLILSGAKIFTSNAQQPWAEAIAVNDGRFTYVGDAAGALAYQSDNTRFINLEGQLVIPGLVDSHAHPGYIDVEQYGEISETNEEDMLAAVRKYADEHPDDEWLRLCCWPIGLYVKGNQGPDKRVLDAVVPDRPLWFVSEAWHSGWLNSKALETIGLDDDGEATGWVKEGTGWQHFAEQFPIEGAHKISHEENMVTGLRLLSEAGVTTLYDAGNFGFEDLVYSFMAKLEKEGKLPVRYEGTYQIFTAERLHSAISEMKRYREEYGGDRLRFNTIKLFMDGIDQNRSSALLEPHTDDPDYVGDTTLSVEELRDFLLQLSNENFDIHIHTMGDLAVRRVLDAVEKAKAIAKNDFYPRVTIAHLGLIDSVDLPRIKELGVIANYTPWWFTVVQNDHLKAWLGDDRYANMYSPKALFDLGIDVTFSSDEWWGGDLLPTYLNPYFGMQVGRTRQAPKEWRDENDDAIRAPADATLSIEQLIAGYTQNGAYQLRMENQIGSIETGKLADLVILNDNLFEIDSDAIWKVKPAAVLMEGEVIQGALP